MKLILILALLLLPGLAYADGQSTVTMGAVTPGPLASATISFSSSGNNTVIAAGAAGTSIRVYKLAIACAASTGLTFFNGATALSGAETMTSKVLDDDGTPWYIITSGNAFIINNSGSVACGGTVWYIQG